MELRASPHAALRGTAGLPGDKSVSHRALMFAALAHGTSRIEGLLEGEDVLATAAALRSLGVELAREDGTWRVEGRGQDGLAEPDTVLDLGNAGTGARLLMGILAGQPFTSILTGDASLRRRPMRRVVEPLATMGAAFASRSGDRLPLALTGRRPLRAIDYPSPVASAQVKSAVLLAGLFADGDTSVTEPLASRDHTERMLGAHGSRGRERARCGRPAPGHDPGWSTAPGAELPGAARSLLRGLPHRGRGPDAGIAGPAPCCRHQPLADRPLHHVGRDGRALSLRGRAHGGWRARGRSRDRGLGAPGRRGAARARTHHDRRVPGPGGGRRVRRRADGDARPLRAAGEGERSAHRHGPRPRRLRRARSRSRATT